MREILQEAAEKLYNIAPNSATIYWLPYGTERLTLQLNSPGFIKLVDGKPSPVVELPYTTKIFELTTTVLPDRDVRLISTFDPESKRIFIAQHSSVDDYTVTYPPAKPLLSTSSRIVG